MVDRAIQDTILKNTDGVSGPIQNTYISTSNGNFLAAKSMSKNGKSVPLHGMNPINRGCFRSKNFKKRTSGIVMSNKNNTPSLEIQFRSNIIER